MSKEDKMNEATKETVTIAIVAIIMISLFVGIPTEEGMIGAWVWKVAAWAGENGYHF
jgi:hypothetical protein